MVVLLLGTAVVSVAGLIRVFASIYTLNMESRKVAHAVTSGVSALVQLRGYVAADLDSWLASGGCVVPDLAEELAMDCYRCSWWCCVAGFGL
jgi:hypothetical protein